MPIRVKCVCLVSYDKNMAVRPGMAACVLRLLQQKVMEMPGIEPGAFRMQSGRSTTEPHPLTIVQMIDVLKTWLSLVCNRKTRPQTRRLLLEN